MKRFYSATTVAIVCILISSFKTEYVPELYPELEAYYNSISTKPVNEEHLQSLENVKNTIMQSSAYPGAWNLIFYCSENFFPSQASQIFVQALCFSEKHKRIKAYSAGISSIEVSPKLVAYLSKIGFRVKPITKGRTPAYEVRYSDKADPIVLFSKTISDKSLPDDELTSIVVCDVVKETACATIKTPSTPFNLAFPKVENSDSEEKAKETLESIASEMLYVTRK